MRIIGMLLCLVFLTTTTALAQNPLKTVQAQSCTQIEVTLEESAKNPPPWADPRFTKTPSRAWKPSEISAPVESCAHLKNCTCKTVWTYPTVNGVPSWRLGHKP
jgi:hypothetical protein